jgi:hypothetical protein
MIKGFGSVNQTNGSGSSRPKNIRILRIRIRNTVIYSKGDTGECKAEKMNLKKKIHQNELSFEGKYINN